MAANFSGGGGGRAMLKGLVFDMDGTLTVPVIDFAAMYRAVLGDEGLAAARAASPSGSVDILHHIDTWAPPEQQKAYEIITHFERQGLDRLQIMPGRLVVCGKRAGAFTCLLDETGRYCFPEFLADDQKPDFRVSSLIEVHSLLETHFDLVPQSLTC
uniref:Haloacid dehalogenase-like hydrolase domain-containing protein At2g33255 n=1 Tax=Elaeis guineensis var. tenera TaxID=51953 RepID=A0A6I9QHW8_ELAGV|nr:haloacid dehalogenase-like hydrolase domain-containing protein At2g33255 [Elaeis guineensis]